MADYTFNQILIRGINSGQIPARSKRAREWFRTETKKTITTVSTTEFMRENRAKMVSAPKVGNMYMFFYDPKMKKKLPYYDRFPLIFPIRKTEKGFLGINLHYLSPILRAKLMDALYMLVNNEKYDETTKLRISYNILNGVTRYKWFKPTVKKYLFDHVRSRFILINSAEWDIALMLPTERFVKSNKQNVWRESKNAI